LSNSDYWTPPELFEAMTAEVGGFDLDAAASDENALSERWYTEDDDSLVQPWEGRVWCNPPYNKVRPWLVKALNEVRAGRAALVWMLIPSATGTRVFREIIWPWAAELRFVQGRLTFGGPHTQGKPGLQDSVLIRFGGEEAAERVVLCDMEGRPLPRRPPSLYEFGEAPEGVAA